MFSTKKLRRSFIFFVFFGALLMSSYVAPVYAALPIPFKIGGTVNIDGVAITQATGAGLTIKVTKSNGTDYIPVAQDIDGLSANNWYLIDIPIINNDQPGGANTGDMTVIHVYLYGDELTVTSPFGAQITVGAEGTNSQINLVAVTSTPTPPPSSTACDFNGDGKSDILWRNTSSGQNVIWYMNGETPIGSANLKTVPDTNWTIVGVGDFNDDGTPNILWRNKLNGIVTIWFMNGTAAYIFSVPDLTWTIVGVGDFNGDGKSDILWRNTSSGQNVIWFMNGATPTGAKSIPTVPDPNWAIVGVGDFNGDGKPDILWRHQLSGENTIWLMNGTTPSVITGTIPTVADINWTIVGVGDFNGDGTTDILWRNTLNGQGTIWFMDGTGAYIPTISDLNWTIVNN